MRPLANCSMMEFLYSQAVLGLPLQYMETDFQTSITCVLLRLYVPAFLVLIVVFTLLAY